MVYEIIKERSAKDLQTTYKEVAPLFVLEFFFNSLRIKKFLNFGGKF